MWFWSALFAKVSGSEEEWESEPRALPTTAVAIPPTISLQSLVGTPTLALQNIGSGLLLIFYHTPLLNFRVYLHCPLSY